MGVALCAKQLRNLKDVACVESDKSGCIFVVIQYFKDPNWRWKMYLHVGRCTQGYVFVVVTAFSVHNGITVSARSSVRPSAHGAH